MITAVLTIPIPYFNVTITKLKWILTYPSNVAYYQLTTDTDIVVKDGQCFIDDAIVQSWGTDDTVISDAIIAQSPWNVVI